MNARPENDGATDDLGGNRMALSHQGRPAENLWQGVLSSSLLFSPDRKELSFGTEGPIQTATDPKSASTPSKYGGQLTTAKWRELRARLNTSIGGRWGSFGEVMSI